jgi:hypothetical protein
MIGSGDAMNLCGLYGKSSAESSPRRTSPRGFMGSKIAGGLVQMQIERKKKEKVSRS